MTRKSLIAISVVTLLALSLTALWARAVLTWEPTLEDLADVTSGDDSGRDFDRVRDYYPLTLPDVATSLMWVEALTWDSNEIWVRFETDQSGVAEVLGSYAAGADERVEETRSNHALPASSAFAELMPSAALEWGRAAGPGALSAENIRNATEHGMWRYADIVIEHPDAGRSTVYLHLINV